jgi:hypothetical protein
LHLRENMSRLTVATSAPYLRVIEDGELLIFIVRHGILQELIIERSGLLAALDITG